MVVFNGDGVDETFPLLEKIFIPPFLFVVVFLILAVLGIFIYFI